MNPVPPELESKLPPDMMEKIKLSLGNLEQALLAKDPQMPNHLREIHRLLITYPESVVLLDDDEINRVIDASAKHMSVTIIAEAAKGKSGGKKAKYTADEL